MSEVSGAIWRPSAQAEQTGVAKPAGACLCAHTSAHIQQLNRQILRASQAYNSTAKSLSQHKREQVAGSRGVHKTEGEQSSACNMAPKLVHKQHNSPLELYSMNNIRSAIEASSELLAPGVRGVNFMKSNEQVNKQSEVYKLVMEQQQQQRRQSPGQQVANEPARCSNAVETRAPELAASERDPQPLGHLQQQQQQQHLQQHQWAPSSEAAARPRCCECGQAIVGAFAKVQQRFIHPHCFNCTTCGSSLKNSGFFSINDKLYCDIHARQVANVMRLNHNFEPNKLSQQPAPNPVQLSVREPRAVSLQRSQSAAELMQQQVATARGESAKLAADVGTSSASLASATARNCPCGDTCLDAKRATISTMFSNCSSHQLNCCHSSRAAQREVVWTWRPASEQQQVSTCCCCRQHETCTCKLHQQQQQQLESGPLSSSAQVSSGAQVSSLVAQRSSSYSSCVQQSSGVSQRASQQHQCGASYEQADLARAPTCAQCKQHIHGPYILAGQASWCKPCSQKHFVCRSCNRSLLACGFIELDASGQQQPGYCCELCYEKYLAPRCSKCALAIKGDCLSALDKRWHPLCFVCGHCKQPFGNSSFYLEDDVPYCQRDWNLLFTTKCSICSLPIEAGDKWIEALNKNYHADCFTCATCELKLEGSTFYCKAGKPYCKMHAR